MIAGTALMVMGIGLIIGFAAAQTSCQDAAMNAVGAVRPPSCTTETVGAALGWIVLAVGGLCFPAAALSTTARFGRPPRVPGRTRGGTLGVTWDKVPWSEGLAIR